MNTIPLACVSALCAFGLLLAGCGAPPELEEAEAAARTMFERRIETGGAPNVSTYSERFWEGRTPEEWSSVMRTTREALGRLLAYELHTWSRKDAATADAPGGQLFVLVFEASYELGEGKEQLSLLREAGAERFEIVDHRFYSVRIQELLRSRQE